MILIRYCSESTNEAKFDRLAENLYSLTSMKLFTCILARDSSSITHYGLIILPIQKQLFGEDLLQKRNYTEFLHHNQTHSSRSSLDSSNEYVQFCASEGTYVRIVPMGNIDIHEKGSNDKMIKRKFIELF